MEEQNKATESQREEVTYMVQTVNGTMCLTPADLERLREKGQLGDLLNTGG